MKVCCIGGGPAGLFLSILLKRQDPSVDVSVFERHRADDTFGFGVVFSDATLSNLREADPKTFEEIEKSFFHWDDINTTIKGKAFRSKGHGFCGLERKKLLCILQKEAHSLGVNLHHETEVEDVETLRAKCDVLVAADGAFSGCRDQYKEHFGPNVDWRPNKFVWLGTTVPYDAFTFHFKETVHGLFRVHAYRYGDVGSTFIVECRPETLEKMGIGSTDEDATIKALKEIFKEELAGHPLIRNRSIWRQFPTVTNRSWVHENIVLVGDAAHTAHFSIGSGTKLAMEDCIYLASALHEKTDVLDALKHYEVSRRPSVKKVQMAAQTSLEWFENTERYMSLDPLKFTYSLLTRSLRVTHDNLKKRDKRFVQDVEQHYFEGDAPVFSTFETANGSLKNRFVAHSPIFQPSTGSNGFYDLSDEEKIYRCSPLMQSGAGLVFLPKVQIEKDLQMGTKAFSDDFSVKLAALDACPLGMSLCINESAQGLDWLALALDGWSSRKISEKLHGLEIDVSQATALDGLFYTTPSDDELNAILAPLVEILTSARKEHRGLLSMRLSVRNWQMSESPHLETCSRFITKLNTLGVDVFSITSKNYNNKPTRLYQAELADAVKASTHANIMVEGGLDSLDDMNSLLAAGRADLIRLEEPLWFNPGFIRLAAARHKSDVSLPTHLSNLRSYVPRSFR